MTTDTATTADTWMTADEICAAFPMSRTTLWRLDTAGTLPATHIGRRTYWRRGDVDAFLRAGGERQLRGAQTTSA